MPNVPLLHNRDNKLQPETAPPLVIGSRFTVRPLKLPESDVSFESPLTSANELSDNESDEFSDDVDFKDLIKR